MTDYGKIPPQAVDLEEAVLGALLIENVYILVDGFLFPEVFYKESHQEIFRAIQNLKSENSPVDILTVVNYLKKSDKIEICGGAHYISKLTNRVASSANLEYHAKIIYQKYIQRAAITIAAEVGREAYDDTLDVFEMLGEAVEKMLKLTQFKNVYMQHITAAAAEVFKLIDLNSKNKNSITGIPTGLTKFDKFSGGLQPGDLIVIGGEPSNGKTSLALDIARNAAIQGYNVGVWSYEMTSVQLTARLMAAVSEVSSKRILMNPLDDTDFNKINDKIAALVASNLYINDNESSDFNKLIASIRVAVHKHDIKLVVIDYIQLLNNPLRGKSSEQEIADIANRLKVLAKNLNINIIAISTLSRDKDRPMPSRARLKRSGDIEYAADVIMLIWLPADYGKDSIQLISTGEEFDSANTGHCIIAKGRNIGMTDFVLKWQKEYTTFSDYDSMDAVFNKPF